MSDFTLARNSLLELSMQTPDSVEVDAARRKVENADNAATSRLPVVKSLQ
jgi:hypothetical protein